MQVRTRSSLLSAISEVGTYGEGSGAMSIGCMGGWIHTSLRGTLAGDLNNSMVAVEALDGWQPLVC